MEMSQAINEIATAMAKAQLEMTGAKRDADNPFYKSKYADLASVREACLGAMNKHGLSVWQFPRLLSVGDHEIMVEVETVVTHSSGQFLRDTLAVPVTKADAQGVGSAISYARRYALGAVAGVAPEDDDGEAAVGRPDQSKQPAAAGAMTSIVVKVLGIVKKPAGNGFKFVITADDGKTYSTFKEPIAVKAKDAQAAAAPVTINFKTSQYGRDIVDLEEAVPEPAL